MAMKVRIRFGVCNTPPADLLCCECTQCPMIPHHHNPPSTFNKERAAKLGKNGPKWLKMAENGWQFKCATSSMHKKRKKKTCYGTADSKLVKKGHGGMGAQRVQRRHIAHMTGRNWGLLLQLAIFLPIQTILHPYNVGRPHVSPHPQHKRCQCT